MTKFSEVHCSQLERSSENCHVLKLFICNAVHCSHLTKFSTGTQGSYFEKARFSAKYEENVCR